MAVKTLKLTQIGQEGRIITTGRLRYLTVYITQCYEGLVGLAYTHRMLEQRPEMHIQSLAEAQPSVKAHTRLTFCKRCPGLARNGRLATHFSSLSVLWKIG